MNKAPFILVSGATVGAWTLLVIHLMVRVLERDAFLVALAAAVVGPIVLALIHVVAAIRDHAARMERQTTVRVIEAMARGRVRAMADAAEARRPSTAGR